jgi:hypothetical protein
VEPKERQALLDLFHVLGPGGMQPVGSRFTQEDVVRLESLLMEGMATQQEFNALPDAEQMEAINIVADTTRVARDILPSERPEEGHRRGPLLRAELSALPSGRISGFGFVR